MAHSKKAKPTNGFIPDFRVPSVGLILCAARVQPTCYPDSVSDRHQPRPR